MDNIFHDSTVATLKSTQAYAETGEFLEIIRRWWNVVNVKNTTKGIRKLNEYFSPISGPNDISVLFLRNFVN